MTDVYQSEWIGIQGFQKEFSTTTNYKELHYIGLVWMTLSQHHHYH